jgi:DNA polymerase delta subunit 2
MDVDGEGVEVATGALSASSSIVLNEGEDMLAAKGESVADALMATSRAIDVQGTGAGAGADERMKAGAGGDEIVDKMSELDVLTNTLYWRLLAPTAPDSLTCFPFTESDPFVIAELPNVFFSGGCKEFGTRLVTNADKSKCVRVICVPEFSSTHTAVLVNVSSENLETKILKFDIHE